MKVTGKPVPTSVGVSFIGYSLIVGTLILSSMKEAHSPLLYVLIFGGLFSGVPGALGVGIILENRRERGRTKTRH